MLLNVFLIFLYLTKDLINTAIINPKDITIVAIVAV